VKTTTQNLQTASSGKQNKTDLFTNFIFRKDLQRLIWQYNEKKKQYFTLDRDFWQIRENNWKRGANNVIQNYKVNWLQI
jgi:hypothetical protein